MSTNHTIKFRQDIRHDAFFNALRQRTGAYLSARGYDGFATTGALLKGALYILTFAALYAALLWADMRAGAWYGLWAALGLAGMLMGLNVSHDAAHNTLFRSRRWNKITHYLTFNALGANAYLWQLRHVDSHHLFPNVDDCDADIDDNPFIRLSPYKPLRPYQRWQWLYAPIAYLLYTLLWVFVKDFVVLGKKRLANLRDIQHPRGEIALFFIAKTAYLCAFIALPLWLTPFSAAQVLTGFLIMHGVSGWAFVFGLAPSHFSTGTDFPHIDSEGYLERSWAGHQVAASLDYHATRRWANVIFGGFNAHVAHHLFPNIHHVHYPQISRFIAELAPQYGLPYRNVSFPQAVAGHFAYLKKCSMINDQFSLKF